MLNKLVGCATISKMSFSCEMELGQKSAFRSKSTEDWVLRWINYHVRASRLHHKAEVNPWLGKKDINVFPQKFEDIRNFKDVDLEIHSIMSHILSDKTVPIFGYKTHIYEFFRGSHSFVVDAQVSSWATEASLCRIWRATQLWYRRSILLSRAHTKHKSRCIHQAHYRHTFDRTVVTQIL